MRNSLMRMTWLWVAVVGLSIVRPAGAGASNVKTISKQRVKAVATMLGERPAGVGRTIADRKAWDALAKHASYKDIVPGAVRLLAQPIPELPDDLFLDFSRTGNRTRWQKVSSARRRRIPRLVLAECLENKGRFIPAFGEIVRAVCAERTWVMPAHDRSLKNFKGQTVDIDLASSALAWTLATADYLLADKLDAGTRRMICDNVRRRALDPFRDMATGKRQVNWWMLTTNNWNAVCLAGVTGAALAQIESRGDRAFFVVAAEENSKSFLRGFTPDGYCSEGLSYWNYGFGHYLMLAEVIHQATDGGVDLLVRDEVRNPATFAARIEIVGGVYPAFADCPVNARPDSQIMHFVSRRYGLGAERWEKTDMVSSSGRLFEAMMFSFPNSASRTPAAKAASKQLGPHTWFKNAGVLICRPGERSACRLAAALKGGHNGEHHNHNDIGSYVVVVGNRALVVDPGSEVYTARTFSKQRYDSKVLNSFGHSVPRVAGSLQRTGRHARGRVLRTEFTDQANTLVLDISSAYKVSGLEKLQRTFRYSRKAAGSLTVIDEVEFSKAKAFGTAVVTLGKWEKLGPGSLKIYDSKEAVRVDIDAGGKEFEIVAEEIHEDVKTKTLPTRIGIDFKEPVKKGAITVKITPMSAPGRKKAR